MRYLVVGVTAVAALLLYVDRVCFSILADPAQADLGFSAGERDWVLGAFFLTYALFQLPAGAVADRFGPRAVLTGCIVGWSLVTALTGLADGFAALLACRLLLGAAEAGAYPAAAGLVKSWAAPGERGRLSAAVALGGRAGGAVAPWLTAGLAVGLVGWGAGWVGPSGVNWRGVLVVYGAAGLLVAAAFWAVVRDRPPGSPPPPARGPLGAEVAAVVRGIGGMVRSRAMWLFGVCQAGVNVGWAFLVTLLPVYLAGRFGVDIKAGGAMQSTILTAGCVGMVVGGLTADGCRRRLGPRWGRAVPLAVTLSGAAGLALLVPFAANVDQAVALLAGVAFLVDLGIPSVWAFAQDVGGRRVGAALGWGNMWGNLAAWRSPILLGGVQRAAGWDAAFAVCGGFFLMAAGCGLLLDGSKELEDESGDQTQAAR